jgi:hypothetical protein
VEHVGRAAEGDDDQPDPHQARHPGHRTPTAERSIRPIAARSGAAESPSVCRLTIACLVPITPALWRAKVKAV